jgi:DNA-directed RNA polymerase subunit RPC12/RpoP
MADPKVSLKVIPAPAIGQVVHAPPVLKASDHSIDYTCGHCGTVLLHAEANQVHGLLIHCTACGSYNTTDS